MSDDAAIVAARDSLLAYSILQWPQFRIAPHHRKISKALQAVAEGSCKRLMVFLPPRHSKSILCSENFPAWFLGNNPSKYFITATYSQDLADDFGRKVRNQMRAEEFGMVFPETVMRDDSASAKRFHTNQGGSYHAVGVGGPLTGKGADCLCIDDPLKNREEADSETVRRRLRDWYTSTAYTRLMPGGSIILIQCMTGDTPVLMDNGTQKPLREIRRGDRVATYHDGCVGVSRVCNWASQGIDTVYKIQTASGKIVRANERHPFLVHQRGELSWVKVKDLRVGSEIVQVVGCPEGGQVEQNAIIPDVTGTHTLKVGAIGTANSSANTPSDITANGRALPAPLKDVINPHDVKVCAIATTRRQSGQAGIERHLPPTLTASATGSSSTGMESAQQNMTQCSTNKVGFVPSASGQTTKVPPDTGVRLPLTTAMTPEKCEDCYATIATSLSAGGETSAYSKEPLNTYSLETDSIVDILYDGVEEVFDIQVEGTENFIANGLVSHNTRWHDDDLAGWLLKEHAHENWHVIDMPAIDKDGKALWPDQYSLDDLQRIREAIGPRDWSALYQQEPVADTGDYFQRDWIRYYSKQPEFLRVYMASDFAVTVSGGDYTEHGVFGVDPDDNLYILDWWSGQTAADVWIDSLLDLAAKWKPVTWFGESGVIRRSVEPFLNKRQVERRVYFTPQWVSSIHDKPTRARGIQARCSMGKVYFKERDEQHERIINQMLRFPGGKHDDAVDVLSLIGRALDDVHPAHRHYAKQPDDLDYLVDFDQSEISWKTV